MGNQMRNLVTDQERQFENDFGLPKKQRDTLNLNIFYDSLCFFTLWQDLKGGMDAIKLKKMVEKITLSFVNNVIVIE